MRLLKLGPCLEIVPVIEAARFDDHQEILAHFGIPRGGNTEQEFDAGIVPRPVAFIAEQDLIREVLVEYGVQASQVVSVQAMDIRRLLLIKAWVAKAGLEVFSYIYALGGVLATKPPTAKLGARVSKLCWYLGLLFALTPTFNSLDWAVTCLVFCLVFSLVFSIAEIIGHASA